MALIKYFNNSGLSALGRYGMVHAIFFTNIWDGKIVEEIVKGEYTEKWGHFFGKAENSTSIFRTIFNP